ncbi:hypothetical protein [Frankia sp. R82]|uniref:hypothetical protein n=1 Tax=Frankia sp. R82 TaxID=2950553 RepID=UPI0020430122|nr:hypothetical protein [Frankia sp. R82]MCM3885311.1 hypothetical protein [Frankia sp. R82]
MPDPRTSPRSPNGHRGSRRRRPGGTSSPRRSAARLPIAAIAAASIIGGAFGITLSSTGRVGPTAVAVRLAAAEAQVAAASPPAADPGNADPATGPAAGTATAQPASDPGDCTLLVPANPLTAQGLATPYQLTAAAGGTCHQADPAQAAFVQATILDPATGKVSVYNPLVVDQGTTPAAPTVTPALPRGAVVGVWFGFNGNNLTLQKTGGQVVVRRNGRHLRLRDAGGSLAQGRCVNGTQNSVFGQFAFCNAPAFFQAAKRAIDTRRLTVAPIGMAADGRPCPTTRDFGIVDQDQSDNVTATYLLAPDGRTAQATEANAAALPGARVLTNASDNGLLVNFVDKALGCTPFTAPDLANGATPTTSLALDELQATQQAAPVALVPPNNPMTLIDDAMSRTKTNIYRNGSNMPPLTGSLTAAAVSYCKNMITVGQQRLQRDQAAFQAFATPDAATATNLYTFLGTRLAASYANLNCQALTGQPNPITVQTDGHVAVGIVLGGQGATRAPATPMTPPSAAPTSAAPTSTAPTATAPTATALATTAAGTTPPAPATGPPHRRRP